VLVVPASWPPAPEDPPGAGDEAEGAAPLVSEARGFGAHGPDAAGSDVGGSGDADGDAGADAEEETDAEGGADEEEGTYPPPATSFGSTAVAL
jgi:hypothetical protein